jgi:hypothetical protein
MYSFQVKIIGGERLGSVVSGPVPQTEVQPDVAPVVWVTVMWEDTYTFSVHNVEELTAFPATQERPGAAVLSMVAKEDPDGNVTH